MRKIKKNKKIIFISDEVIYDIDNNMIHQITLSIIENTLGEKLETPNIIIRKINKYNKKLMWNNSKIRNYLKKIEILLLRVFEYEEIQVKT